MIYLYPSKFTINRIDNNTTQVTFQELFVELGEDTHGVMERLNALCGCVQDRSAMNNIIKSINIVRSRLQINGLIERIGSIDGFYELASCVYLYNVNYNDDIYIKLSKTALQEELKNATVVGYNKKPLTSSEIVKMVDTMLYNWVSFVARYRGLVSVVKLNRQGKTKLVPSLVCGGTPFMEFAV